MGGGKVGLIIANTSCCSNVLLMYESEFRSGPWNRTFEHHDGRRPLSKGPSRPSPCRCPGGCCLGKSDPYRTCGAGDRRFRRTDEEQRKPRGRGFFACGVGGARFSGIFHVHCRSRSCVRDPFVSSNEGHCSFPPKSRDAMGPEAPEPSATGVGLDRRMSQASGRAGLHGRIGHNWKDARGSIGGRWPRWGQRLAANPTPPTFAHPSTPPACTS